MSKAVLISIRPMWCEKIVSGEKTIEVRKTRPKLETPFKCYIYETQGRTDTPWIDEDGHMIFAGRGQVIGEFTCDRIYELETKAPGGSYYVKGEDQPTTNDVARQSCLSLRDMHEYLKAAKGYGWRISDLVIYDTPKALDSFWAERICTRGRDTFGCEGCWDCEKRPPQSWCYVEETK